jgi:hypothetical protein
LHVLGTPPAFVLSQDQTLHKSLFMKNLDGSLKNKLFVSVHLHEPTVLYSNEYRTSGLF